MAPGTKKQQKYQLVAQDEEKTIAIDLKYSSSTTSQYTTYFATYLSILLISLSLNIFLLLHHTPLKCLPDLGNSIYSGRTFDTPKTFHSHSPYWDPNLTLASMNEAWDSLNTDPMAIALSNTYIAQTKLPASSRFPWDTEKSIYYVKGIHNLHCLKLIRHAIVAKHYETHSNTSTISLHHLFHCLDNLRQDVMCHADDTPMPAPSVGHIGDGQVRQCRDWDALIAWAEDGERNACHRFDDYREATNTLELFAHCPDGSPYQRVVERYFEIHGHRDVYEVKAGDGDGEWDVGF